MLDHSLHSAPVLTLPPAESFNLKSFRHITCPAPETTPSSSSSSSKGPTTHPHVREDSFASDSSQRISVAAFREAQARCSTTDSPVPSLPGDRDNFASSQVWNHRRSSALSMPLSVHTVASQPCMSTPRNPLTHTSSALPLSSAASDTSSESSEEGESESEEDATLRPNRQRTVTTRWHNLNSATGLCLSCHTVLCGLISAMGFRPVYIAGCHHLPPMRVAHQNLWFPAAEAIIRAFIHLHVPVFRLLRLHPRLRQRAYL